ncbi:MAG: hypothetical protein ACLQA5_19325 [Solirubrobacteraceae bacterium]
MSEIPEVEPPEAPELLRTLLSGFRQIREHQQAATLSGAGVQ